MSKLLVRRFARSDRPVDAGPPAAGRTRSARPPAARCEAAAALRSPVIASWPLSGPLQRRATTPPRRPSRPTPRASGRSTAPEVEVRPRRRAAGAARRRRRGRRCESTASAGRSDTRRLPPDSIRSRRMRRSPPSPSASSSLAGVIERRGCASSATPFGIASAVDPEAVEAVSRDEPAARERLSTRISEPPASIRRSSRRPRRACRCRRSSERRRTASGPTSIS